MLGARLQEAPPAEEAMEAEVLARVGLPAEEAMAAEALTREAPPAEEAVETEEVHRAIRVAQLASYGRRARRPTTNRIQTPAATSASYSTTAPGPDGLLVAPSNQRKSG